MQIYETFYSPTTTIQPYFCQKQLMLDTTILFTLIIALMIAAFLAWLFYLQRKNKREELKNKSNSSSLP